MKSKTKNILVATCTPMLALAPIIPLSLSLVACTNTSDAHANSNDTQIQNSQPLSTSSSNETSPNKYGYSLTMFQNDLANYFKTIGGKLVSVTPNQLDPKQCIDIKFNFHPIDDDRNSNGDSDQSIHDSLKYTNIQSYIEHVLVKPILVQDDNNTPTINLGLSIPSPNYLYSVHRTDSLEQGYRQTNDYTSQLIQSSPQCEVNARYHQVVLNTWAPDLLKQNSFKTSDQLQFVYFSSPNITKCFKSLFKSSNTYEKPY